MLTKLSQLTSLQYYGGAVLHYYSPGHGGHLSIWEIVASALVTRGPL